MKGIFFCIFMGLGYLIGCDQTSSNQNSDESFSIFGEWHLVHQLQIYNGGDTAFDIDVEPQDQIVRSFFSNGSLQEFTPLSGDSAYLIYYTYQIEERRLITIPESLVNINGTTSLKETRTGRYEGPGDSPFKIDTTFIVIEGPKRHISNWFQVLFHTWAKTKASGTDLRLMVHKK